MMLTITVKLDGVQLASITQDEDSGQVFTESVMGMPCLALTFAKLVALYMEDVVSGRPEADVAMFALRKYVAIVNEYDEAWHKQQEAGA